VGERHNEALHLSARFARRSATQAVALADTRDTDTEASMFRLRRFYEEVVSPGNVENIEVSVSPNCVDTDGPDTGRPRGGGQWRRTRDA